MSRYERERAIAGRHREEEENDNDGNGTDTMKDSQILMQSKMTVDEEDGAGSGSTWDIDGNIDNAEATESKRI